MQLQVLKTVTFISFFCWK